MPSVHAVVVPDPQSRRERMHALVGRPASARSWASPGADFPGSSANESGAGAARATAGESQFVHLRAATGDATWPDPDAHELGAVLRGRWDWDVRSVFVVALACAALLAGAWTWSHRSAHAPGSIVESGQNTVQAGSMSAPGQGQLVVERSGVPIAGGASADSGREAGLDSSVSTAAGAASGVAAATTPDGPGSGGATVTVHVVGRVRRPGVYRLAAGARVADAIRAAGGVTRATVLQWVNQARPLADGEQVRISRAAAAIDQPGGADPGGSTGSVTATGRSPGVPAAAGPLDLNTATAEQLDSLPRVGPVTAQKILQWRSDHGRFASVDQLQEVSGIGEATFAALRPLVTVG